MGIRFRLGFGACVLCFRVPMLQLLGACIAGVEIVRLISMVLFFRLKS
jgi:hypothetical protein